VTTSEEAETNMTYIPENDVIPESGHFSRNEIVDLLRKYCKNPEAVYFIADMLEE